MLQHNKATKLRRQILDTCQNIVFNVTGGKNIPPKQYAVPMTMHHLKRNKTAVDLVHKSCPSMKYHKVLEADNATAEDAMKNMDHRKGAVVPSNLVPGRPTKIGKDNLDTNKESAIAGHSAGFHVTQAVAYQPGPPADAEAPEMRFVHKPHDIPDCLHSVLEINQPIKKDPPYVLSIQDVDTILNYETGYGSKDYSWSAATDMAFVLYRIQTDRMSNKKSDWTEYNTFIHRNEAEKASVVGQCPLLNAKSDEHNTIYTVGECGKYIVK